jgi:hypothetical protein
MARASSNLILKGFSGKLGELVVKQYANKIVITRKPDMSGVKKTELQKLRQSKFRQAVAYAQSIIRDPKKKVNYAKKLKKGQSVYHAAIKEFLG